MQAKMPPTLKRMLLTVHLMPNCKRAANPMHSKRRCLINSRHTATVPRNGVAASNALSARVMGGDLSKSFDGSTLLATLATSSGSTKVCRRAKQCSSAWRFALWWNTEGIAKVRTRLASNEYNNAYNRFNTDQTNQYNRLAGIAGSGQTATNQMGAAASNYGTNVGNNLTNTASAIGKQHDGRRQRTSRWCSWFCKCVV